MQFTDPRRTHLHVEIQAKECTISPDERTRMQSHLEPIGEAVRDFPNSALWVNIVHHLRVC